MQALKLGTASHVPERTLVSDLLDSDRGVLLGRTFMDEVIYNPAGNAVTLVKRCDSNIGPSQSEDC